MARDAFGDEVDDQPSAPAGGPPSYLRQPEPDATGFDPPVRQPEGFGETRPDRVSVGDGRTLGPPMILLGIAAACVAVSIVLGLLAHNRPGMAFAGWVIGGFLAVGLLALFTMRDAIRRADAWYMAQGMADTLRSVLVGIAVLAVALNAFQFALWKSRQ